MDELTDIRAFGAPCHKPTPDHWAPASASPALQAAISLPGRPQLPPRFVTRGAWPPSPAATPPPLARAHVPWSATAWAAYGTHGATDAKPALYGQPPAFHPSWANTMPYTDHGTLRCQPWAAGPCHACHSCCSCCSCQHPSALSLHNMPPPLLACLGPCCCSPAHNGTNGSESQGQQQQPAAARLLRCGLQGGFGSSPGPAEAGPGWDSSCCGVLCTESAPIWAGGAIRCAEATVCTQNLETGG